MTERNYDPDLQAIIPMLPDISDLSTAEKIQAVREGGLAFGEPPAQLESVERQDRAVPGPDGAPTVAVRIHRPRENSETPRPGVFEIHGGGFMIGSKDE